MRGSNFNKYQFQAKLNQIKYQAKYWWFQFIEVIKQIFVPLAIFQLVRTLLMPTPFDVFILVVIFIFIIVYMLDWV